MDIKRKSAIIEGIPLEGPDVFTLNGEPSAFGQKAVEDAALKPFEGKYPPAPKDKEITITFGAPGASKSFLIRTLFARLPKEDRRTTAGISYDEDIAGHDGAIYNIPGFEETLRDIAPDYAGQHAPVGKESLEARRALWRMFQPMAQRIRSLSLRHGLDKGFSLLVDTTSSSKGTQFLIAAARELGFRKVNMVGAFAPFPISRERVEARARPTSAVDDLVGKRIGVLQWMESHAAKTDRFELFYNPSNDFPPKSAIVISNGTVRELDERLIAQIIADIKTDRAHIESYLQEIGEEKIGDYLSSYDEQAAKAASFLKSLELLCPAFRNKSRNATPGGSTPAIR